MNPDSHREFMIELAELSGEFIRPYYGQSGLQVELKADSSPVTAADRGAEELMRKLIKGKFPDHGVIGEEFGSERPDAEFVWVLDPIDGTKSFISGVPLFGTLIALLHRGQPVLGCIHQPVLGQLLIGDNTSCSMNGHPVKTRDVGRIEDATLLTSDPVAIASNPAAHGYAALMGRAKLARMWGDCYGYYLVATGSADVMYDPVMNPWDIAALVPVIRGAGGVITDSAGKAPYPATSIVAAGTAGLHASVIAALNPGRPTGPARRK
ncbi:MAG TPA: histidinol-phosphatase [Opitutaceae bacterium]|nr:histidinol-phosphatase [Opitutaceae bacterium]